MAASTTVTGKMMYVTEKAYSNILTEISTMVTGQMTSSTEKVLIFSIREIATKVLIFWENVPEKAFTIMPMEINM